jgi:hypothetical protein
MVIKGALVPEQNPAYRPSAHFNAENVVHMTKASGIWLTRGRMRVERGFRFSGDMPFGA